VLGGGVTVSALNVRAHGARPGYFSRTSGSRVRVCAADPLPRRGCLDKTVVYRRLRKLWRAGASRWCRLPAAPRYRRAEGMAVPSGR